MISWLVILLGLASCWHYTDLDSTSTIHSLWAPLGVMLFAIALAIKLVFTLGTGGSGRGDSGGSDGFFGGHDGGGFDGGGDCGGGGDC